MPRSSRGTARAARWAVNGLLALAVAACLLLAVGPGLLGYRALTVLSGSMRPLIGVGSLVVVTREPVSELAPGQIITITAPIPGHPVVTHRVVEVVHLGDGHVAVRTRGDRNPTPDPWLARLPGDTVWRYRADVPYVGRALHVLTGPRARLVAGVVVPVALATWVLSGLWLRSPTRPRPAPEPRRRRPTADDHGEPVRARLPLPLRPAAVVELPPEPAPDLGPAERARRAFAARAQVVRSAAPAGRPAVAVSSPDPRAPAALAALIPAPRPPHEPSPIQRLRAGQGHAPA